MYILLPQIWIGRGEVVHHLDALLQGKVAFSLLPMCDFKYSVPRLSELELSPPSPERSPRRHKRSAMEICIPGFYIMFKIAFRH